jgi:putative iron-dependent peroxidase
MCPHVVEPMDTPQAGIFALGDSAHGFFEFTLRGAEAAAAATALVSVREPRSTVGGANRVIGFRPSLWKNLAPDGSPVELHDFDAPVRGADGFTMPATQADIWVWFSAASYDVVFDMGLAATAALGPYATLEREQRGWSYRHNRDLTGFEDGTENPKLDVAPEIAAIEHGKPGAGGSVLLFQVWQHHARAFDELPVETQEAVIGRTKPDSVEFDDARMPKDSHVSRTKVVSGGEEQKIFRRNVPYGTVSDHGTLFIGFCAEQFPMHRMLEQMAGIDGPRDALTRYTSALTGAYYFIPSVQALRGFAPDEEDE